MPLLPVYTEQLYSPLPPVDLLRRLTDRTALVQYATPALGGVTSRTHYHPMHLFEGTIANDYFVIRRLTQRGTGRNWTWNFGGLYHIAPGVEAWVTRVALGGTQLQLRYQPPLTAWGAASRASWHIAEAYGRWQTTAASPSRSGSREYAGLAANPGCISLRDSSVTQ